MINQKHRDASLRYGLAFSEPEVVWPYITTPQKQLKDRSLDYRRGKGLGGSSAVNFGDYVYGSKEDFELWAHITGDTTWSWPKVQERLHRVECVHAESFGDEQKDDHLILKDHGKEG